jgi:hypothetical protein
MRSFMTRTPHQILCGKSRRMRWAGHVAPKADKRNAYRILVSKREGRLGLNGSIRLKMS